MAPHLEDVHEVRRESQRHAELVRVLGEGLDHQHLVELPAVHGEPPGHPQGAAREELPGRVERNVGVGEVDRRLHGVLRHAGVEHDRSVAVQAELEPVQEARAIDVEAELALRQVFGRSRADR
jgi:hypothetical protein